jgi:hypothetical protein
METDLAGSGSGLKSREMIVQGLNGSERAYCHCQITPFFTLCPRFPFSPKPTFNRKVIFERRKMPLL